MTFSYGQTAIGSIPGVPQVTPWTVFGLTAPDSADPRWGNLARFLQTFNNHLPAVSPAIQALPSIDFNQPRVNFGSEDGASDPNERDGMERGTYTWDPATGAFAATAQVDTNQDEVIFTNTVDTNADAGIFDPAVPGPVTLKVVINGVR